MKQKIIVVVRGGLVVSVFSTNEDVDVEILDWDNVEFGAGGELEEIEAENASLDKECKTMHEIR